MNLAIRSVIICIGLLLLWEGIVLIFQLPEYILPAPWSVFTALYTHAGLIYQHAIPTIIETLLGLLLGVLLGSLAGFMIVFFPPLALWMLPVLIMSQAIPTFAIAPLFVIWFGYGLASKIAITVLMLFFPVTSSFYDGIRRTPTSLLDMAAIMHATHWRLFWMIRIPAALPSLAAGIRIATVFAPIGAIVGEWVGSSRGLGYLMLNSNARMQIDMMFAVLIIIMLFAIFLYYCVDKLLRFAIYWEKIT